MKSDYQTNLHISNTKKLRKLIFELPKFCADFLHSISMTTTDLTRISYAIDYKNFLEYVVKEIPRFADKNIIDFTDNDLSSFTTIEFDQYVDYLRLYYKSYQNKDDKLIQANYINHENGVMRKLSSLRSLYGYLFRMQRIPSNTASLIPLPKIHEKPIIFLSEKEVSQLIRAIWSGDDLTEHQKKYHTITKKRDFAIIMLFLGTGLRISECVGINIEDLNLESYSVLVTRKGGNQEILYFPEEVADAVKSYLDDRLNIEPKDEIDQSALFLSMQKRRISQRAVQKMVKKYALIATPLKKKISPHKLRSTYATSLYKQTGDIYLVADALGHSDVNTTRKHYASMSEQHKKDAALEIKIINVDKKDD